MQHFRLLVVLLQTEKYGLSFIKLHSPPEATPTDTPTTPDATKLPSSGTKLGAFVLKEESRDLPAGSFFFKRNTTSSSTSTGSPAPSLATKVRMASAALQAQQAAPPPPPSKDRGLPSLENGRGGATSGGGEATSGGGGVRGRKRAAPGEGADMSVAKRVKGEYLHVPK